MTSQASVPSAIRAWAGITGSCRPLRRWRGTPVFSQKCIVPMATRPAATSICPRSSVASMPAFATTGARRDSSRDRMNRPIAAASAPSASTARMEAGDLLDLLVEGRGDEDFRRRAVEHRYHRCARSSSIPSTSRTLWGVNRSAARRIRCDVQWIHERRICERKWNKSCLRASGSRRRRWIV